MLRVFHHYISGRKLWFFLAESATILVASSMGAGALSLIFAPARRPLLLGPVGWGGVGAGLLAVLGFQFALYLLDLYNLRVAFDDRAKGVRLLKAGGAAAVALSLILALAKGHLPPGTALGWVAGALLGALIARLLFPALVGRPLRILVVGDGARARDLLRVIEEEGEDAFSVEVVPPSEVLGQEHKLSARARSLRVDQVVLALDEARGKLGTESLLACRFAGFRLYDDQYFTERVTRRICVSSPRVSSLVFADGLSVSRSRRVIIRTLDLLSAGGLLLLFWPLMALLALAIRLDSKGPIFYRQERVGRWGVPFWLWKFRSMRVDAEKEGAVWAKQNDDRVTRIGRLMRKARMDELPQLFNVLKGEMSVVGPRPERPVFVADLKAKIPLYRLREAVKPGLTGWAQIRYPYGASVEDAKNKLEFDLYYIKHGSLFLDLSCLFHTVRHVLVGRGAR